MSHIYTDGKLQYPSVTTILSEVMEEPPGIRHWKRKQRDPDRELTRRADIGTLMHYRILNNLAVQNLELPKGIPYQKWDNDYLQRIELCEDMFGQLDIEYGHPRKCEVTIFDRKNIYAGQYDLLAPMSINGGKELLTIGDLKSSKAAYDKHKYQIGGYYHAIGRVPEQGVIICLHPFEDGNPELVPRISLLTKAELDFYADGFLEMVDKYYEKKGIKKNQRGRVNLN